jgi:hypothetical protein
MVEYKLVYKAEIKDWYYKTRKIKKTFDSIEVSEAEQANGSIDYFQELGMQGWKYAETFGEFGAYLFMKEGEVKIRYQMVNANGFTKDSHTLDQQASDVLTGLNELGKEGWKYVSSRYVENPFPHIDMLMCKEEKKEKPAK